VFFDTLRNGIPTLRAYRDGVLRFHGELAPFTETLEETAQLGLLFRGPFVRLIGYGQSRGRFTVPSVGFTATDAGQIAKALIDALPEPGRDDRDDRGEQGPGPHLPVRERRAGDHEPDARPRRLRLRGDADRVRRRQHRPVQRVCIPGERPVEHRPVSVRAGNGRERA
jgi:hypothetical protein